VAIQAAATAALKTRQEKLMADARSVLRALQGWGSIRDQADWNKAVEDADKGLDRGLFLLERLGAERYLDPQLMAVLLVLRRRLVDETGAHTALEYMLIDSAVMAYYHQLKINGWIGNFSALLESEFFGKESLTAKLKGYYGSDNVRGLRVEDIVHRLGEELFPLLDRANRLMLRNLKALHELKLPPHPNVTIEQAAQVNVAQQQVNAMPRSAGQRQGRSTGRGVADTDRSWPCT
jgi:hypothetical protein